MSLLVGAWFCLVSDHLNGAGLFVFISMIMGLVLDTLIMAAGLALYLLVLTIILIVRLRCLPIL